MKPFLAAALFLISICVIPAEAVDYKLDTTFSPTLEFAPFLPNHISDLYVQPDGKVLIGGNFYTVNGEPVILLARLNPDGTRDTTFNSPLTPYPSVTVYVSRIRPLADGKFLVLGRFGANGEYTHYAKLNADGSLDNSMPIRVPAGEDMVQLPDGKFISCSGRLINNETYWIAHRLNSDGSVDPTFRITFSQGTCQSLELVADGKVLISGVFHNGNGTYYEPIQRFNSDGSHDPTFNAELPAESPRGAKFVVQADGKIVMSYEAGSGTRYVQRFGSNGELETTFANCTGSALLPRADGTTLVSGCRKWPTGPEYQFANVLSNGVMEQSLDLIPFNDTASGFKDAGGGKYYVYGSFTYAGHCCFGLGGRAVSKIARLMPYSAPIKAKFDFDGDGRSDHAVWRPSDTYWYLLRSTAGPAYSQWGVSSDLPVAEDYDFDGKTDIGIYRNGIWYWYGSAHRYQTSYLGENGSKPMLGNFDARGIRDLAVRRIQSGLVSWRVLVEQGYIYDVGSITGELPTDVPIIGDFDGDSRDEVGYFRDGLWVSKDYMTGAPVLTAGFGVAGDIPVPEDYDGDGQTDYAIYRPSFGQWWINRSTAGLQVVGFGISSDIPVPADYDGDGKTDIAIYRGGQWWQILSGTGSVSVANWGTSVDIPIPAQTR